MKITLPYGHRYLEISVPDGTQVLESRIERMTSGKDADQLVREAMENPVGSPRLSELARGKKTALILLSDHTRPVPSRVILPRMIGELRAGSPGIEIRFLVATGTHRATTEEELRRKLGDSLYEAFPVSVHDAYDEANLVYLGDLPSGFPLHVNRACTETNLLVAEGFIEPHFFAGYSGGRKSILPGAAGFRAVSQNHCSAHIDHPLARTGILEGNPIHRDMAAAAHMAGLAFIVNVVVDQKQNLAAAFAGSPGRAHDAGCRFIEEYCRVAPVPGDIVITSNGGEPTDQNVYQCVKALTAAEATAAEGAVIIICAECSQGSGGDDFHRILRDGGSPEKLYARIMQVPPEETEQDQWQCQILARILQKHTVIFVTRPELREMVTEMGFVYAASPEEALEAARREAGEEARITAVPNGIAVVVEPQA
ncbi:MAG: nickel-dependent lactate racemase [Lachnospiraceae bacterium]|nr:nickel-dependent lactate racemase [Lachnospiraceae bacterium]